MIKNSRTRKYITDAERERLIAAQKGERHELRNIALLRLGFGTGLRAGELQSLLVKDVILPECPPTTDNPNNIRLIILGEKTKESVFKYIEYRHQDAIKKNNQLSPSDPLFASQKGGQFKGKDLINLISRIFKKAGIIASSHSFRVTFANNFSKHNSDSKTLQSMLRHKSAAMALKYMSNSNKMTEQLINNAIRKIQD